MASPRFPDDLQDFVDRESKDVPIALSWPDIPWVLEIQHFIEPSERINKSKFIAFAINSDGNSLLAEPVACSPIYQREFIQDREDIDQLGITVADLLRAKCVKVGRE